MFLADGHISDTSEIQKRVFPMFLTDPNTPYTTNISYTTHTHTPADRITFFVKWNDSGDWEAVDFIN